jgi:hypothetical protein
MSGLIDLLILRPSVDIKNISRGDRVAKRDEPEYRVEIMALCDILSSCL